MAKATQIAVMVITGLVAIIWVYFRRLYLVYDPNEWRIANQQLGYLRNIFLETRFVGLAEYDHTRVRRARSQSQAGPEPHLARFARPRLRSLWSLALVRGKVLTR